MLFGEKLCLFRSLPSPRLVWRASKVTRCLVSRKRNRSSLVLLTRRSLYGKKSLFPETWSLARGEEVFRLPRERDQERIYVVRAKGKRNETRVKVVGSWGGKKSRGNWFNFCSLAVAAMKYKRGTDVGSVGRKS